MKRKTVLIVVINYSFSDIIYRRYRNVNNPWRYYNKCKKTAVYTSC